MVAEFAPLEQGFLFRHARLRLLTKKKWGQHRNQNKPFLLRKEQDSIPDWESGSPVQKFGLQHDQGPVGDIDTVYFTNGQCENAESEADPKAKCLPIKTES